MTKPIRKASFQRTRIYCGVEFTSTYSASQYCGPSHYIKDRIKITDAGCWEWTRCRHRQGYGLASWKNRMGTVHRLSYEAHHGPIPDDMVVRHKCDNPPCCNPDHLELGTQTENMGDMVARGRHRSGIRASTQTMESASARLRDLLTRARR